MDVSNISTLLAKPIKDLSTQERKLVKDALIKEGLTKQAAQYDTFEIATIAKNPTTEEAVKAAKTGFFDKIGTFVKGHKIATAVLGAIAALGVAFGAYTKVQANKVEAAREAQMEAEAQTPQAETV